MLRSIFRRTPKIQVPADGSGHRIQQVKLFRKPLSKPSNFLTTFFAAYIAFQILDLYEWSGKKKSDSSNPDGYKIGRVSDAKEDGLSENWKKQHAEMQRNDPNRRIAGLQSSQGSREGQVIITVPIWIRAAKSKLYEATDPEWKEYVKLQGDKQKVAKLKGLVGDQVVASLKSPVHLVNLKHIGFNGKAMCALELVPQLFAPPHYEMPALYLERDGIGIGWRRLSPQLGARMDDIFRPTVTCKAALASAQAFFSLSYMIARNKLARATGQEAIPFELPFAMLAKLLESDPSKQKPSAESSTRPTSPTMFGDVQAMILDLHKGSAKEMNKGVVRSLPFSEAIAYSASVFQLKQFMGTAQRKQKNTRGVIQIRGNVICVGNVGKYKMEVIAFYDPANESFIGPIAIHNPYIIQDFNKAQKSLDKLGRDIADKMNKAGSTNDPDTASAKSSPGSGDTKGT